MGGILLSFLPTIIQVQKLVLALEADTRFQIIETTETLLRTWHVTERSVRPNHRMVAHSGFLTTAVRCQPRLIRTPSDSSADEPNNLGEVNGEAAVDGRDE
jgi:tRNA (adenine57-N1/adenine58-N1)-methyltransferase